MTRNLAFSTSMAGAHITAALAEPCSSSTGAPFPAARMELRRIGREALMRGLGSHRVRKIACPTLAARATARKRFCPRGGEQRAGAHPPFTKLFRRDAGRVVHRLQLGRAVLELGDLPERVELGIGKQ